MPIDPKTTARHEALKNVCKKVGSDYTDYGGSTKRWEDPDKAYPDCSCGCRYFYPLAGELGLDWGVCVNPQADRAGLLTFEHQTGAWCFDAESC